MNYDCIICSLPFITMKVPLSAPAILSGVLNHNGYNSKVLDFNIDYYIGAKKIFPEADDTILLKKLISKQILDNNQINNMVTDWCKEIISHKPKYVGFSIFTTYSIHLINYMIRYIKKNSNIKIIIGGGAIGRYLELINNIISLDIDLIDHVVIGHGEKAILDIISQKSNDKFTIQYKSDYSYTQLPDYSDLDFTKYDSVLPSYNSLGCPFNCPYCTLSRMWKYSERPVNQIYNELKMCKEKHNINEYRFGNSYFNILSPNFEELYNKIKDLNIKWSTSGWRVINNVPKTHYKLLAESGCHDVNVGIESGSEKVRKSMRKKFTNDDIFKVFDNLSEQGITINMTFIVGYPTEDQEDFQQTLDFFEKIKNYNVGGVIVHELDIKTLELQKYKNHPNVLDASNRYKIATKYNSNYQIFNGATNVKV